MEDVCHYMRPVLSVAALDYYVPPIAYHGYYPLQQAHCYVHLFSCHQSVTNLSRKTEKTRGWQQLIRAWGWGHDAGA
ncbi:hypothetical protein SAE02_78490 [Skermanella aerolata]|uniref:Uncharacterized protein n=1 Tax=Skermanella aerolata TaxID=393310 RepID=A0A512E4Q7_9PROT|nr:hypothetical protein SAE02_78490 [Skermanella aerolata]